MDHACFPIIVSMIHRSGSGVAFLAFMFIYLHYKIAKWIFNCEEVELDESKVGLCGAVWAVWPLSVEHFEQPSAADDYTDYAVLLQTIYIQPSTKHQAQVLSANFKWQVPSTSSYCQVQVTSAKNKYQAPSKSIKCQVQVPSAKFK